MNKTIEFNLEHEALPLTKPEEFINCPDCNGRGEILDDWPKGTNRPGEQQTVGCATCRGMGEIEKEVA